MKTLSVLAVVACTLAVSSAHQGDKKVEGNKDKSALTGTWQAVKGEAGGKAKSKEEVDRLKMVITEETITAIEGEKDQAPAMKYKIDPSQKPAHIDISIPDGPQKDMPVLGIYELNGDTLRLCFTKPGGERPKTFATTEGERDALVELKREKK